MTYHILPCIMHIFLPKFLREKEGCALYLGIVITDHGCNNPVYNAHKKWVHVIHGSALHTTKYSMSWEFKVYWRAYIRSDKITVLGY